MLPEELGRGWGRSRGWDQGRGRTRDWGGMGRGGAEMEVSGQGGTKDRGRAAARPILLLSLPHPHSHPSLVLFPLHPALSSLRSAKSGQGRQAPSCPWETLLGTGLPATWLLMPHFPKHPEVLRVLS